MLQPCRSSEWSWLQASAQCPMPLEVNVLVSVQSLPSHPEVAPKGTKSEENEAVWPGRSGIKHSRLGVVVCERPACGVAKSLVAFGWHSPNRMPIMKISLLPQLSKGCQRGCGCRRVRDGGTGQTRPGCPKMSRRLSARANTRYPLEGHLHIVDR